MLLCFDIGNTNIVVGVVDDHTIIDIYRFSTNTSLTVDDYAIKFKLIFEKKYPNIVFEDAIISSVVPNIDKTIEDVLVKYFNIKPIYVVPGIKTGLKIKSADPRQLGADLLVGLVAAYQKYGGPAIVVDMGTATKLFVVTENAEIIGGIIYPGVVSAEQSLISSTSKLNHAGFLKPEHVIGNDTNSCIQSGAIYGTASVIDGLVKKIKKELNIEKMNVILTGGLSSLVDDTLETEHITDDNLLIDGLIYIYYKNKKTK